MLSADVNTCVFLGGEPVDLNFHYYVSLNTSTL